MFYPDLLWTLFALVGGFLLLGDAILSTKQKIGAMVIFFGFIYQAYYAVTNPWVDAYSPWQLTWVVIGTVIGIGVAWRGWSREVKKK